MYHPLIKDKFSDVIDLTGEKFFVDPSIEARKKLAMCINDNVLKNWEHFSATQFVNQSSIGKHELVQQEKIEIVDRLMEKSDVSHEIVKSVDKILIAHRNSKIFMFCLTGPFLVIFQLVKYIIKYGTLYYFYLQAQKKLAESKVENQK